MPRGTETVLIVEDEQGLRQLVAKVLQGQGYQVLEASNGREALRLFHERKDAPVDLVLTDMVMPEMSGQVMAEWLQTTHPDVRILFTSGYTDCGFVKDGEVRSDINFLAKPYTTTVLLQKVREVIDAPVNSATPHPENVVTFALPFAPAEVSHAI